jgi:hypothetical protein
MSESISGVVKDDCAVLALSRSKTSATLLQPETDACGGAQADADVDSGHVESFADEVAGGEDCEFALSEVMDDAPPE